MAGYRKLRKLEESRKEGKRTAGAREHCPQRTAVELRLEHSLTNVSPTASMMYQYFVKIVPTIYVKTDGEVSLNALHPLPHPP